MTDHLSHVPADKRLSWLQLAMVLGVQILGGVWFAKGVADAIDFDKAQLQEIKIDVTTVRAEQTKLSEKVDALLVSQGRVEEHSRDADRRLDQIEAAEHGTTRPPASQWRRD